MSARASVIHVITQLELGGAQENTLTTVAGLDRSRFEVSLWHGPGGMLDEEAARIPALSRVVIPSLRRAVDPVRDARTLAELIRRLERARREARRDGRALILHTHSSKAGILGRAAAALARVPVVIHSIHGFGFHEGQDRRVQAAFVGAERRAARWTDAFISVSRANLAEARARGIVRPEQRAVVIRSGFDLTSFRAELAGGPALRRELGLGANDEVFVAVANLKPQKDPLTLVRAMAIVARSRPRAVLLYAGDGELRAEVEAELGRLALGDRFRLLGWRRDIPALIAAGDVVVLSSIFEGLPRSAVQALVARKPFAGTRVDGTPEVIRAGVNGYLAEPRDPAGLAAAMIRAMETRPVDPADVALVEDWSAERMVEAQERLYLELIARS